MAFTDCRIKTLTGPEAFDKGRPSLWRVSAGETAATRLFVGYLEEFRQLTPLPWYRCFMFGHDDAKIRIIQSTIKG